MKRSVILLSIFLLSLVTAAPVLEFQNENIFDEETIFATLSTTGEFAKQLMPSDISFYEGRRSVYFERDIREYNGTYYIYVYANRPGEFKISVDNVLFREDDGVLQSKTIEKEFNITDNSWFDESTNETKSKSLGIKPGFAYYPKDSSIKLWNKGTEPIDVKYGKEKITINATSVKEIKISPEEKLSFLKIESYKTFEVPIFYPTLNDEFISPSAKPDLRTSPEILVSEIYTDTKKTEVIELLNFGAENITDIEVSSELEGVKFSKLEDMGPKDVQNLTITFDIEESGHILEDAIITFNFKGQEEKSKFQLSLFVLPKGTPEESFEIAKDSCDNLGGKVCSRGTLCDGDQQFTSEAKYCCFGNCVEVEVEEESGKGVGAIIAVLILAGIGAYAYYAYNKQKKLKPKSADDKIKDSTKKFETRMSSHASSRVSGNLTKS